VLNDIVFAFMLVFMFTLSGVIWYYCDTLLVEWFPDVFLERLRKLSIYHNQDSQ